MDDFISCLQDAGCGEELIAEVFRFYACGDSEMVIRKLRHHRSALMEELHGSQKKVDCLDFLLRNLTKTKNGKDGGA